MGDKGSVNGISINRNTIDSIYNRIKRTQKLFGNIIDELNSARVPDSFSGNYELKLFLSNSKNVVTSLNSLDKEIRNKVLDFEGVNKRSQKEIDFEISANKLSNKLGVSLSQAEALFNSNVSLTNTKVSSSIYDTEDEATLSNNTTSGAVERVTSAFSIAGMIASFALKVLGQESEKELIANAILPTITGAEGESSTLSDIAVSALELYAKTEITTSDIKSITNSEDWKYENLRGEKVFVYRGKSGEGIVEISESDYDSEAYQYYVPDGKEVVEAIRYNKDNFDNLPLDAQKGLEQLRERGGILPEDTCLYFVKDVKTAQKLYSSPELVSGFTVSGANDVVIADDGSLPLNEVINHEGDHIIVNFNQRTYQVDPPYVMENGKKNRFMNEALTEVDNVYRNGSNYTNQTIYSSASIELNKGLELASQKLGKNLHQTLTDDRFNKTQGQTARLFQEATGSDNPNIFIEFLRACSSRMDNTLSFDDKQKNEQTIALIESMLK